MSRTESRGRWWITYFLFAVPVHLAMQGLARTAPFADSLLQHSWVRIAIGVVVTSMIMSLPLRRSAPANAGS